MDDAQFDNLTRALATSRRGMLKRFAALLLGAAGGALRVDGSAAQACARVRRRCAADDECCSGFCDPTTGRCICGPGTEECSGECVAVEQYLSDVDNCGGCGNRCRSVAHGTGVCAGGVCGIACDAGYTLCGERCCSDDRKCCNGDCCGPHQCCAAEGCVPCRCGIGIESYDAGEINPDNACQYCDPTRDRDDWTLADDGFFCGDGRTCCNGDCCSPSECCDGVQCSSVNCSDQCEIQGQPFEEDERNPANACQVCKPDRDRFNWTLVDDQTACGVTPGRVCCNGDCCSPTECCNPTGFCEECGPHCRIGGDDVDEGAVNPADPCQVCKPDVNTGDWSIADDGADCSGNLDENRVCCAGVCCQDGHCCNEGACGGCSCQIGLFKWANGAHNPLNNCQVCNPDRDRDDWSPAPNRTECGLGDGRECCEGECCPADECCNNIGECVRCPCRINGDDVVDGAVNPANTCQVCNVDENREGWTVLGDGETCGSDADDRVCCGGTCCPQGPCCVDGACQDCGCEIGGGEPIEPNTPNPDNICQVCDPSRARFSWSPVLGEVNCGPDGAGVCCNGECCPEDQCCLLDACGECLCAIGDDTVAPEAANPANACEVCKPKEDPFAWTPVDDETSCGVAQVCCGGICCEDGECCGLHGACESCAGCTIDGETYVAGTRNPANECEWCDPAVSLTAWSSADHALCGDQQVCCNGACCPDGTCCRPGFDFCSIEWCGFADPCEDLGRCGCTIDGVFYSHEAVNPSNECQWCHAYFSTTAWYSRGDFAPCGPNGDRYCCSDTCCELGGCCNDAGVCEVGSPYCEGCIIGGRFYRRLVGNPDDPCEYCDPESSATSWSPRDDWTFCGLTDLGFFNFCCAGVCCFEGTCGCPPRN